MKYFECKKLCYLNKKDKPIVSKVVVDEFTDMVEKNFDYDFTGESEFYPYEFPDELKDLDFQIMVITGASGRGKSTFLREFLNYKQMSNSYDNSKAIVSNFKTPKDASERLSAVGLNSMPVWCRPRNVLSIGEGFRADVALNLDSYTVFDEFTSTIDRNVAKSTCNSVQRYIRDKNLTNIVFCSCHNDYIPFLKPDIVVDLDRECVFDCRGACLGETFSSKYENAETSVFGACLGTITI